MPSICRIFVLALLLAGQFALAGPAQVNGVRIATDAQKTRVALDLNQAVEHRLFTLKNPHRVVVDIKPGRMMSRALPLPAGRGSVARIRSANREDGSVRIVLDLKQAALPKSFLLASDGQRGDRLVIDLVSSAASASSAPVKSARRADDRVGRDLVVAIDPGHGGKDPGARGRGGTREKDVVLRIARQLAQQIDREVGMSAYMTRNGDQFVRLRTRMERARAAQADLFISIHADAFRDVRVRGATVYVLSAEGASAEADRRLAERENAADLVGGVKLNDKDDTLASVLLDLSQNASLSASIDVGESILSQIGSITKVRKTKVQHAPFLVLKSPDVPSILIETAFISNPTDERNLISKSYQEKLAGAIFKGVKRYFYENPPPGTRVAQLSAGLRLAQSSKRHLIRNGETLSGIANRYNVSVNRIRSANNLRGDKIVVGKVLTIPPSQDI